MQPPARAAGAAVEPGAEHPEARARLVLHAVVVAYALHAVLADLGPRRAPPVRADALGAFRTDHAVGAAAPAEQPRRVVRKGRDRVDRLGPGEQADRTKLIGRPAPLARRRQRRLARDRALGDVTGVRRGAPDAVRSETVLQAIDQR